MRDVVASGFSRKNEFFDIVWDDPPTPLRGHGATSPAVFAGSSRAEAPVGAKAGPQAP
jgi:hypothetical protein